MSGMTSLDVFNTVFASYIIGDHRTAIKLTHPEGTYRFSGNPAVVPWVGLYVGPELKRWFDCMKDNFDFFYSRVSEVHAVGDRVFFEAEELWRVRATGKSFTHAIAGFCVVENGLVTSYREYADTAMIEWAFHTSSPRLGTLLFPS